MATPFFFRLRRCYILTVALLLLCGAVLAQRNASPGSGDKDQTSTQLPRNYEQWLDQDVRWIIVSEERDAFLRLTSDRDRDRFIEEFWKRRDPTPDTPENEFKEEHYRRLAYANMHFGWGKIAGWETDRGRIYICYGPADAIKDEPVVMQGGIFNHTEIWHYRSVEHLEYTSDMNLRFIDFCGCGDYRLLGNPTKKDMPTFR